MNDSLCSALLECKKQGKEKNTSVSILGNRKGHNDNGIIENNKGGLLNTPSVDLMTVN